MNLIRLGDTKPGLSVLICTIATRQHFLTGLLAKMFRQLPLGVEIVIGSDDGEEPIGDKRNRLLDAAWGKYVCFFDDDDTPGDDYFSALLAALEAKPDCVGFRVRRTEDGALDGEAIHSARFTKNFSDRKPGGHSHYERVPNHLNPVRIELARKIRFKSLNSGEDTDYAVRLRPLINIEEFVDRVLYRYDWRSQRAGENTNLPTGTCGIVARVTPVMDAVIVSDSREPHLRQMTATTIRTLRETVPHVNVIVVESSGADWPGCRVVRPTIPFNYNAYLMLGAAQGTAPWIGLFNNDLIFREGWWLKILQAHARTGIPSLSPRCSDDFRQLPFADAGVAEGYSVGREVSGWAILVKRDTFTAIGGLDDGPTFWYSDNAYSEQLERAGIKHALVADSIVNHRGSKTLITLPAEEQAELKADPTGRFA